VSYGDDLEKVKKITLEAVENLEGLAADEKTTFFFQEFSDSSINFSLRLWVNSPEQPNICRCKVRPLCK
jgi:small conductance mechanosensitive channel